LTGTWITAGEATAPEYWIHHLRGTVRFAEGLAELFGEGDALLLEVGPGKTLSTLAKQQPGKPATVAVLSSLRHPQDTGEDLPHLLGALGQVWANGGQVDWSGVYARERRLRVVLPTYPFERKRFWVEPTDEESSLFGMGSSRKKKDVADWFYLPDWRRSVPPPPLALEPAPREGGAPGVLPRWLLFADGAGLAERLAARLREGGLAVSWVEPGGAFARLAADRFTIDPAERGDYEALFEALRAAGELPDVIGHLWGIDDGPGGPVPEADVAATLDRGFYSLIHLTQGLVKAGVTSRPVEIGVVGNGFYAVLPGELPVPEKAAALGPVKVISQEHANLAVKSIDVPWPPAGAAAADELVDLLAAELAARLEAGAEPIIAYRGGDRWTQGYHPVRIEPPAGQPRLR